MFAASRTLFFMLHNKMSLYTCIPWEALQPFSTFVLKHISYFKVVRILVGHKFYEDI